MKVCLSMDKEGLFHSWYPSGKKKNERKYKDNVLDSVRFFGNGMMEKDIIMILMRHSYMIILTFQKV